ncbi:maleylpyruvate isomerase family mycothiol-dependent enzyme [Spongiactinospora sp. 9N601]|uniref:maleylpyruvate isomerase family mycothiol-dependent enzyme n=1 Tax=Spongiactinospora sp. 9N601 TaxID=3375149 RepID=UPI003792A9CA
MDGATERLYLDALDTLSDTVRVPARPGLLAAARTRRRPMPPVPAWAEPYAARVAAMDALLASADPADWDTVVVEGWNMQELVAHLAAKDGLLAAAVGAPVGGPPVTADDADGRTAEVQEHQRGRPPELTRADWRAQADALCGRLGAMGDGDIVDQGGFTAPAADHVLARMLETWIHTDDAAKAIGLALPLPLPAHIRPAADLCVRLLPLTMLVSGRDGSGRAAHVTLTGEGGGEWDVALGLGETVAATQVRITCDVVEFCFLLSGRGRPEEFAAEIEGDRDLGREILLSAPALSGP